MKNRFGFTLVEVLTVIGIIAIITAIIFPIFAVIRERGRRTSCQSNLRQIAMGIQMYVHDNDGLYPLEPAWARSILPYVKNELAFQCPDNPQRNHDAAPLFLLNLDITDYAYDWSRLDVFAPPLPSKVIRGISETAVASPANTWLNMDLIWSDHDGPHFTREVTTPCGEGFGNTLHSGGGNYSFVDGHVRWLTPEQFGEINCAAGPLPAPFNP